MEDYQSEDMLSDDNVSFEYLLDFLASSSIDAMPPFQRKEIEQLAAGFIHNEVENESTWVLLCQSVARNKACMSPHAQKRLAQLLLKALLAVAASSNGGSAYENYHNILGRLCSALCKILSRTTNPRLIRLCLMQLDSADRFMSKVIFDALSTLWKDADESSFDWCAALSLSAHLLTKLDEPKRSESHIEMVSQLLKLGMGTKHGAMQANHIFILRPFIQSISQAQVNAVLAPTISLKLRANPESVIYFVSLVMENLSATIDFSPALSESSDVKLFTAILKQIKSTKEHLKGMAANVFTHIARMSGSDIANPYPSATTILLYLMDAMTPKPKDLPIALALNQPNFRHTAYEIIGRIGGTLSSSVETITSLTMPWMSTIDSVLHTLVSALLKEPAGESCVLANQALMIWTWIYKALSRLLNVADPSTGYIAAIDYYTKPMLNVTFTPNASTVGIDFRSLGLFILLIELQTAKGHVDLLDTLISDIIRRNEKKCLAGLQMIVETSVKKFTNYRLAPQIDGIIAIYMELIYADVFDTDGGKLSKVSSSTIKILTAGSAPFDSDKITFLYTKAMLDAASDDSIVSLLLPMTISRFNRLILSDKKGMTISKDALLNVSNDSTPSAAAYALAACVVNFHPKSITLSATNFPARLSVMCLDKSILAVSSAENSGILLSAIFSYSNTVTCQNDLSSLAMASQEARALRDSIDPISETAVNNVISVSSSAIRRVARMLLDTAAEIEDTIMLGKGLLLLHSGSTAKCTGRQRQLLTSVTVKILSKMKNSCDFIHGTVVAENAVTSIEKFIIDCATFDQLPRNDDNRSSDSIRIYSNYMYLSSLSLLSTLGMLAGRFKSGLFDDESSNGMGYEIAWFLCVERFAPLLSSRLLEVLHCIEHMSNEHVDVFRGIPNDSDKKVSLEVSTEANPGMKRRGITEDEKWEEAVRRELEEKKLGTVRTESSGLSVDLHEDLRRKFSKVLISDFKRCLLSLEYLLQSDIELGNTLLQICSKSVLWTALSPCYAFESISSIGALPMRTLRILAECVYELDDTHVSTLIRALRYSCTRLTCDQPEFLYKHLPSHCPPVSEIVAFMQDQDLSLGSFLFVFPIIRSVLTGPRTCSGCEQALYILQRHASLLNRGEKCLPLQKDMVETILGLITHDRFQTFTDPSPIQALESVYLAENDLTKNSISTSDLSPLLGTLGALGVKHCRIAAMTVVTSIIGRWPELANNNALLENRLWINCFAEENEIKTVARAAWKAAYGACGENDLSSPSKIVTASLLPLLSSSDLSIGRAAAIAFAHSLRFHEDILEKIMYRVLNSYIDAYPTAFDTENMTTNQLDHGTSLSHELKKIHVSSTAVKKPASKKPVASAAASAMASLTATKKKSTSSGSAVGKAALSNILKPKERSVDKELLEAQLKIDSFEASIPSQKDDNGKVLTRRGTIRVITSVAAPSCSIKLHDSVIKLLVGFLLTYGLADRNDDVYGEARDSLRDIVASCGSSEEALAWLFPVLENVLRTGLSSVDLLQGLDTRKLPEDMYTVDRRKEGVVVALGSAAAHLQDDADADKISDTIDMLIKTLSAPSESVQSSVALCLSRLMKKGRTQDRVEDILSSLIKLCLHGNSLAERRGAAYGIAAVIKGSGIAALKKYDIIKQLEDACTNGTSNTKEGSLFAMELLSAHLGVLFEPFVIALLPALLQSFSDNSVHVRAAAQATVATVMNKLSGHGVKLILPSVLSGLQNDEWRAAVASISLLGSMSNLAPKQLATCLPQIVPQLTEAFAATHPKVKAAAEDALDEIVKVVRNPEIKDISKTLLNALKDPSSYTSIALEALIETEFLHAIDAPSLSLIVPVLHRGLRDRAATTKRYGALIAGNICTMIHDPKDFVPYVPLLVTDLKATLMDPIPDCRSTAAKSLGSLTRSLGEVMLPDLRPWLVEMLKSDVGSSVEKSGAAQGLSEVLCAGGTTMVESVLREEILPLRNYSKASVREGFFWLLTFLPSSLGQAFAPLIDYTFPSLIFGLSDESESVRDVSMRAGRIMIQNHGKAHIDKFLPSLESSLSDVDSRIRVSSLTLIGDLFSTIAGAKISKGDSDTQDDLRQTERAQSQIALILGPSTRKRILSNIYLRRSDSAAIVRQNAIQVWKSVVSVTPRTLREILETLVGQIATALASGDPDRTSVGGRCLGDLTSKLGDTVLPEIIPVLQKALYSDDKHTRIGSCVGLAEVISCSSKDQLLKYLEILVKAVRDALCDQDEDVRKMAISAFQQLYSVVGSRVLDEIVPGLLVSMDMDDETRVRAVYGLTGILRVRSKELLPFLVPRLLRKPITINQAKALGSVCSATSGSIHLFFPIIIPALLLEISSLYYSENEADKDRVDNLRTCARSICGSIERIGVNPLINEIISKCSSDKDIMRKESCWLFSCLIEERNNQGDFYEFIPLMMRELLYRLNDDKANVVKSAHDALFSLSNNVTAEVLVDHIEFMRNIIASLVSDARRRKGGVGDGEFFLPGFNIPKGLEPLLPIYQRGILYGDSAVRETAASGLGELIKLTSADFLGPISVKITGPLLRIVGDRNPSSVKVAIIETLGLILLKSGPLLKAFAPQFQTTFVKALSDPSRSVRHEAIKALGLLMPLSMRVDPLIKELVSIALGETSANASIESAGVIAIQIASLEALVTVLQCGGVKVKTSDIISSVLSVGRQMAMHEDEDMREIAMKVIQVATDLQKSL